MHAVADLLWDLQMRFLAWASRYSARAEARFERIREEIEGA